MVNGFFCPRALGVFWASTIAEKKQLLKKQQLISARLERLDIESLNQTTNEKIYWIIHWTKQNKKNHQK